MQKFSLGNVRLYAGGLELTGWSNKVELSGAFEEKETTTFGDVDDQGDLWKAVTGTLGSAKLDASGFWQAGGTDLVDELLWSTQGSAMPWTALPREQGAGSAAPPAPGDLAWFVKATNSKYQLGGQVGDIAPYQASASSASPLVRGRLLHHPGAARTVSGAGAAVHLGPVEAGRALYAGLHVLSVADAAAALTVAIESAATEDFAAPVVRATLQGAQAVSGQSARAAGPVDDEYWRASWTIAGGAAPSFLFLVSAGVA